MKCLVLSVTAMSGISKKTGKPYNMRRVKYCAPLEKVSGPSFELVGAGFDVVDLEITDQAFSSVLAAFESRFKGLPVELDLDVGMDRRGQGSIRGLESPSSPSVASPLPTRAA